MGGKAQDVFVLGHVGCEEMDLLHFHIWFIYLRSSWLLEGVRMLHTASCKESRHAVPCLVVHTLAEDNVL